MNIAATVQRLIQQALTKTSIAKGESKMKKRLKRSAICVLGLVIAVSVSVCACAKDDGTSSPAETDGGISSPTETFIQNYSAVFEGKENYYVLTADEENITEEFAAEYRNAFESGDYQTVWDAVLENGYTLVRSNVYSN